MKIERVVAILRQLMDKEPEKRGFAQAGLPDDQGNVVLIGPDQDVPLGGRLY